MFSLLTSDSEEPQLIVLLSRSCGCGFELWRGGHVPVILRYNYLPLCPTGVIYGSDGQFSSSLQRMKGLMDTQKKSIEIKCMRGSRGGGGGGPDPLDFPGYGS